MKNTIKLSLLIVVIINIISTNSWSLEVSTLTQPFNASGGLVVAENGDIFVADFGNSLNNGQGNNISKVTLDGVVTEFATGFTGASGITFDNNGDIIQASISGGFISRVTPDGVVSTIANQGINGPVGVAVDSTNAIFVANCGDNTIRKIDTNGVGIIVSQSTLFNCPNGLTIDDNDNLYAVNFFDGKVIKIDPAGNTSLFATTPGSSTNAAGGNGHIIFGNEQLYLVSHATHQVFGLTLDGELSVISGIGTPGHDDGDITTASFSSPNGIGISPDGKTLYVNELVSLAPVFSTTLNPNLVRAIQIEPPFKINAGLSGAWYEPATSGSGFLIDVLENRQQIFIAWFTWEELEQQNKTVGSPQHRWLTAFGGYNETTANLVLTLSVNGVFDNPAQVTNSNNGSININFESCTKATVEYSITDGPSGEIDLLRLTPDQFCETLNSITDE